MAAGVRAAALTRQLLAFSRKQVLEPRVLDLNSLLAAMEPMLRRLLGENIELLLLTTSGLGRVRADPSQIEQVVGRFPAEWRQVWEWWLQGVRREEMARRTATGLIVVTS